MTARPAFALSAETTMYGLSFAAMRMVMLHEAQEHDMPVIENTDDRVTMGTPFGQYSFGATPEGVTAIVSANKQDWLFVLKENLVEHLAHSVPDAAAAIRWSDSDSAGGLPPNFHFATVQSVRPVGSCFLRVRLKCRNLSSFQDDAIHFRVVLPPNGIENAEWPVVSENGTTTWPKGDKALHRPVYTTRWIDHAQGLMDFDVFVHEGGRVTDWARQAGAGTRVAIIGPGGGGIPETNRILMFADETALPAAARILESLPADTKGHVTLSTAEGALCAYPVTAPAGVSVTWRAAADVQSLADHALAAFGEFPDHFLWCACEKADAQRVRAEFKAQGGNPANSYIAAYWSR